MADMKVVDLDQQVITLGSIRAQGWAEGDAMTIAFDGPAYNYVNGGDGEAIRSKNFNRSAVITLRLMQSSVVNDLLSALHIADYLAPNGAGVVPFAWKDLQGTTMLAGRQCWIEAPPDPTIGSTGQAREWKLRVHKLDGVFGGN